MVTLQQRVWIKLYLGEDDPQPKLYKILRDDDIEDVFDLTKKIKEEAKPRLNDISVCELDIYPQGTTLPVEQGVDPLPANSAPPAGISFEHPLIAIAPVTYLHYQQARLSQHGGLPPRTPHTRRDRTKTAPPSIGKAAPKLVQPRKSPSSEDGILEGLRHASDESNGYMQCTSTPIAVALLEVLEKTIQDHENKVLDDRFYAAAQYVLHARNRMAAGKVLKDMGRNERFFTGAMANAMNSVLRDGYCVLHQACLGVGSTHSDLSATRIDTSSLSAATSPFTLMVGEGKWQANSLREETRGQMFNEVLRHRAIDSTQKGDGNYGPSLLVAFDKSKIEIDLAFPSTKGGKLEKDEVVAFSEDVKEGEETFWTVRILRMSIEDCDGKNNLAIVLGFMSDALEKLYSWRGQARVQHKIPMPLQKQDEVAAVEEYAGENVTIIKEASGSKFVYKEYCYHLRQYSAHMAPQFAIEETDRRQPPPDELLSGLGWPYAEWAVHNGPFGTAVLRYPFIQGNSCIPSVTGWLNILQLIKTMHDIDFIHGDLLPRNVVFGSAGEGYVIDFDLSRKVGGTYVSGYNYGDFKEFRHDEAKPYGEMKKDHDLHSLRRMSDYFFDLEDSVVDYLDLDGIIDFFRNNSIRPRKVDFGEMDYKASGSPNRPFD